MIPRPRAGHGPVKHGTAHAWAVVRAFAGEFTVRDVHARCEGVKVDCVRAAVARMVRSGHVALVREEAAGRRRFPTKVFRCARPEVRSLAVGGHGLQGKRQLYLWRAMRTLKSGWGVVELAAAASTEEVPITPQLARGYVWRLTRAGIVTVLQRKRSAGPGLGTLPAVYRLKPSANTGPKAPEVYREAGRGVFDPNCKVWHRLDGEVRP